jgi:hypothetical protein
MKKYMIADLMKDLGVCSPENLGGCKEYNNGIGESAEKSGSYYNISAQFDYKNDNYVITIDYKNGSSQEKIVDGATAEDFITNGLDESKRSRPMPWPFGDKEFLHWPNQMGK